MKPNKIHYLPATELPVTCGWIVSFHTAVPPARHPTHSRLYCSPQSPCTDTLVSPVHRFVDVSSDVLRTLYACPCYLHDVEVRLVATDQDSLEHDLRWHGTCLHEPLIFSKLLHWFLSNLNCWITKVSVVLQFNIYPQRLFILNTITILLRIREVPGSIIGSWTIYTYTFRTFRQSL
jgi:hypothetical protein